MNGYGRLSAVRHLCNVDGTTADDDAIKRAIEQASAYVRVATGRQFHTTCETAYLSGNGCRELWLGRDLISVTTLKVSSTGDQPTTFGYSLEAGTDYTLWPRNAAAQGKPYRKVILNPAGQLSAFPAGVDNVELVGKLGYSEVLEAVTGTAAVTVTIASTTGLTWTTSESVVGLVEEGDMLHTESEIAGEVLEVTPTTIQVRTRGANGSTAAAHTASALYVRRYPDALMRAVEKDAARHIWNAASGFVGEDGRFREAFPAIRDALMAYADPAAVL